MACRRRLPASARASLPLPAAPDAQRWAPRVREEKSPRHLPRPGGSPTPGRASRQDREHHPTRDSAPRVRAGSRQRGRRSSTARTGTVRGVSRGLASGTAGTGHPASKQRWACVSGLQRPCVRVASLTGRGRSSAAVGVWEWPPRLSRQRPGRQGPVAPGVGSGWPAEGGASRAGGGTPRPPRRCPMPTAPGCGGRVRRGGVRPTRSDVVWLGVVGRHGAARCQLPCPTRACRRLPPAFARASLRLPAAPDA